MPMRTLTIVSLLSLVISGACAASPSSAPAKSAEVASSDAPASSSGATADVVRPAAAPAQARAAAPGAPPTGAASAAEAAQQNLPGLDRMIIRTFTLTLGVGDVQEAYRLVERIALEQGGVVAASQIRQDGDRTMATMTVRVPANAANVQLTLDRLRGVAARVIDEQAQGQDVTEEHVDLESRLRNLRASEDSLLALLSKAQRVEDLLQVQRELTNVRGQIEQIQGRKQALERRSEMATINLQMREQATFGRDGWRPDTIAGQALAELGRWVSALGTAAIWLLIFTPVWGGLLAILWLVRRLVRVPRLNLGRPEATPAPTSGGGP